MAKFDKVAYFFKTSFVKVFYNGFHRQCIRFVKGYIRVDFKILDIACGTGSFLNKLKRKKKGLEFVGTDQSEKMLEIGRKKFKGIRLIPADAENLPFQDNCFDFVSIIDSFYYFQDKKKVLSECSRVLKLGGYLLIYTPSIDNLLTRIAIWSVKWFCTEKGTKHLYFKEINKLAEDHGFELVRKKLKGYPLSPFFKCWLLLF